MNNNFDEKIMQRRIVIFWAKKYFDHGYPKDYFLNSGEVESQSPELEAAMQSLRERKELDHLAEWVWTFRR